MSAPEVLRTVDDFRRAAERLRSGGGSLGLVPTMGALHDGHSALMREARRRTAATAVTIFVNPTQFGPKEDLARYPRDLAGDVDRCASEGVSIVFAPDASEMYPDGPTAVTVHAGAVAEPWHLWSFHAGTQSIGALACRERLALEGFRVA